MNIIRSLCEEHTDLTDEETRKIEQVASILPLLANIEDSDIFLDCPTNKGDSIVVAEAKPAHSPSSYKMSVVGLLARKENEPAVARTFRLGISSRQMKAVTQESMQVVQSVEPIHFGQRVIGVLIVEKQADRLQAVEQSLHFNQQSYKRLANALTHMINENNWLTECIDEALIMIDQNGLVAFRNSLAQNLYAELGFVEDILGKSYDSIRLTDSVPGKGNYSAVEVDIGKCFFRIKYVRLETQEVSFAILIKDVTGIKEQEKELVLKSVVIKEMHHRVKNNLQTIASLLRLQIRRTDSKETRQVLGESLNRILTIAATHELLAQSGVDNVKIGGVILKIKNNTVRYFAESNFDVRVVLEGDDFEVESDLATTIALTINELLQNSLEHAFVNQSKGLIRIVVEKGELYSQIQVIDDGIGFDIEKADKSRLGLSIVKSLVQDKLRGKLNVESRMGETKVTFSFLNNLINRSDVM